MTKIVLIVGGIQYVTKKDTLCKYDSLLKDLIIECINSNNPIEIDRDGEIFKYILNFLRSGDDYVLPSDEYLCRQILCESKYYGLTYLIELLKIHINKIIFPEIKYLAQPNTEFEKFRENINSNKNENYILCGERKKIMYKSIIYDYIEMKKHIYDKV